MQRKSAEFGEIYDVYAIRLLVDEVRDCYAALGIVHSIWRPIPGQFDDYIAVPKNNLYQSLHTAVIALDGKPLEIQIRTHQMHQVSEVGIAAHWRYKEGTKSDREYDAKLAWLRQLMDWQRDVSESDATEFVEGIKLDIFQDQVFVFTPKGDIKDLPAGATPLDFAYRIHTDVGHRTIGAKVNNRLVPLDYRLKNGDIVEIVTTKGEHGPSRDWLNVVRTSHAREKIRQWFKRKDRDENIVHGRESLERELRRLARTSIAAVGAGPDRRGRAALQLRLGRRLLRGDRLRRDRRAVGGHAPRRRRRRPEHAADGRAARAARPDRRRPGQGRRRPARPLRQVLPPDPGRPDRRVHHPRQGRHGPPPDLSDGRQRARGQPAHRGRMGGRADRRPTRSPSGSRPTTGPGLLSDITQVVAENKVNILAAHVGVTPDHTAVVTATLQVASVVAAGPGDEPDRDSSRTSSASSATSAEAGGALARVAVARPVDFGLDADLPSPARHPRPAAGRDARLDAPGAAAPPTSPRATATARSRRRCSSRPTSSSAASARSPTSSRRSCSGSRRGPRRPSRWALRPEPTAGIVRAYVQHGMQTWPQPVKLTHDRADVPLRPAAGRPLPPVLAVRHRGDRRSRARPIDAEIIELGMRGSTATPASTASRSSSTRSATRPAGRPTSPS